MSHSKSSVIASLYLPWIIANLCKVHSSTAFLIAWLGSFYILYRSISYTINDQEQRQKWERHIMSPTILLQAIFAGYMCLTSIFYFLEHFSGPDIGNLLFSSDEDTQMYLIAQSQLHCLLGHTALTTGLLTLQTFKVPHRYEIKKDPNLLLKLCIFSLTGSFVFEHIPALSQLQYPLLNISNTSAAFIFIKGLSNRKTIQLYIGGLISVLHLISAALSGYKEQLFVYFIILMCLAIPSYKKIVCFSTPVFLLILFYFLPTFNNTLRWQSWINGKSSREAQRIAYESLWDNEQKVTENSKNFLSKRLSETNMFIQYLKNAPGQSIGNGFDILWNSIAALIPRSLWSDKPITEKIAMERVYNSNVVNRASNVSAKTRPVIDGYLIAGLPGIFIYLFIYGLSVQGICNLCLKLFGSYTVGCIILFNSIFQPLWRGNTMEFLLNNTVYGLALLFLIHWGMRLLNLLTQQKQL